MLKSNKVEGIVKDGLKSVSRNRISVEFQSAFAANSFLNHNCLQTNKLKATVPTYNVTRMGLVRNVPKEWSMTNLVESMELPGGCGIVLKARRLNRKIVTDGTASWIPTQSVVCTFSGQILPQCVYVCYNRLPVEKYLLPTIQCHNCCRFGHIKSQCRSKPRCFKCSKEHTGDTCEVSVESVSCLLCSGNHQAIDKKCPEYARQNQIKLIMSEQNISYLDASTQVPAVRQMRSFSEVAGVMFAPTTEAATFQSSSSEPLTKSYRKTMVRTP